MKERIWKKRYNAIMSQQLHFRASRAVDKLWSCYEKYPKLQGISADDWIKYTSYKRCWSYIRKTRNIPKWVGNKRINDGTILFNRRKRNKCF